MEFIYKTDIGNKREVNQDFGGVFTNQAGVKFAIVADGLGGHLGGDVASEMAVTHLGFLFEFTDFDNYSDAKAWLEIQINLENDRINEKSRQYTDLTGMGTTVVLFMIFEKDLLLAHAGDSRAYRFDGKNLEQLTEDHSLVNELVKSGKITPADAQVHPQKNIITRTIGIDRVAHLDIQEEFWQQKDTLMLCTDGLTNMLDQTDMVRILSMNNTLEKKAELMIEQANLQGGLDNITVLLIAQESEVTP